MIKIEVLYTGHPVSKESGAVIIITSDSRQEQEKIRQAFLGESEVVLKVSAAEAETTEKKRTVVLHKNGISIGTT